MELAASAGLILDPWQAHVLDVSLGERPDGKHSAFEVGLIVPRQNGKGSILEARELAGLFLLGEQLILHSAHKFDTALEAFRRILFLIESTSDLDRRVLRVSKAHGEEGIELRSGQRLRFKARTASGGRGFSGDTVILDEALELSNRSMGALMPTLSARPDPQIWYTSTPPDTQSNGEVLQRVRNRGRAGTSGRLAYFEWSADPDIADAELDDPAVWADANPGYGARIFDEFILAEREAMTVEDFKRERLCIWDDGFQDDVIDLAAWGGLVDESSAALDPVAFAVDVSPDHERASIAVAGRRADGAKHVEVIPAVKGGISTPRGTSWVVPRLVSLIAEWKPCAIVVDSGATAGSLLPAMREQGIDPLLTSTRNVGQAFGAFYSEVMDGKLHHLGQEALTAALAGAKTRSLGDAQTWDRKNHATDITPLVAVTLASWGFNVKQSELLDVSASVW